MPCILLIVGPDFNKLDPSELQERAVSMLHAIIAATANMVVRGRTHMRPKCDIAHSPHHIQKPKPYHGHRNRSMRMAYPASDHRKPHCHTAGLPPAAQAREAKKIANTFVSTGRNIFVHYATPILQHGGALLLASGLTKKRFYESTAQVFQILDHDELFLWHETANQLRLRMKLRDVTAAECIEFAGLKEERLAYLYHAEVAIAGYLGLPAPVEPSADEGASLREVEMSDSGVLNAQVDVILKEKLNIRDSIHLNEMTKDISPEQPVNQQQTPVNESTQLLDTLPKPFTYEPNMLYSHFARYDLSLIPKAEGKHQTAMLRQIADLFDKTVTLFYYYAVPHPCKQNYPPTAGETVTGQAAEVWRFLEAKAKGEWQKAAAKVKKMDLEGLEMLRLESLDAGVLRLHGLARDVLNITAVDP